MRLARTPEFVSRETGSAELEISASTWDRWVDEKVLPAPAPGFPAGTVRWHWPKVVAKLAGGDDAPSTAAPTPESDIDRAKEGARHLRDGQAARRNLRVA